MIRLGFALVKVGTAAMLVVALACGGAQRAQEPSPYAKEEAAEQRVEELGTQTSPPPAPHSTTLEGVEFELDMKWAGADEERHLDIQVTARAADGLCHGIYEAPLSRTAQYRSGNQGGMHGRLARPGRGTVLWLDATRSATLQTRAIYHFGSETLEYVVIGVFEVESSQPGMTFAPKLFRLDVSNDKSLPTVTIVPPSYTLERDDGNFAIARCPPMQSR